MANHSAIQDQTSTRFDAIIIGAGIAGLYQLYKLREMGLSVRVFEAGTGVGGTWYWNRYPGARFDSESWSYGYSWSKELLQEWEWSEHFSPQPETLRYVNHVADKFDLRKDIEFGARVKRATYDEQNNQWEVQLEDGKSARTWILITAVGILSTPVMPTIEGMDSFTGAAFHTAQWPHQPVDFAGKRVAVIGTGATGVQTIQEVAKTAGQLTIFQRTPNYCAPLNNSPIGAQEQQQIKASYEDIFARCKRSHGQFIHDADPRYAMRMNPEERDAHYEKLYSEPGFGIWMGNFRDIFVDEAANATINEFIAKKIRQRVDDPATAEKLIPTDHGFGTRRVPLETNYYEVYNQDNVRLVDLKETPIERVTPTGIKTSEEQLDFDIIVYATGFDAVTGSFDQIHVEGVGGQTLREKWRDGPHTYLGLQVNGFPNLMTLVGPHNAATFCNIPRCIEQNVEWVTDLLEYMRAHKLSYVEANADAADEWTEHVFESAQKLLLSKTRSWFNNINPNLAHKQKRTFVLYAAGAPLYRDKCDEVAANNYAGFTLK
jgi:cation diffusion facilitator CzcD-associated flavoprotein CzcO